MYRDNQQPSDVLKLQGIVQSSLSYLDSHVTRFLLCFCHFMQFKSPNAQCGTTVEIKSRDWPNTRDSTVQSGHTYPEEQKKVEADAVFAD